MKFRIRKGEVEVEFEGEPAEALSRYDELLTWVRETPEGSATASKVVPHEEKRVQKRTTGESRVVRERLGVLKDEGFFKTPKGLGEIRKEMQTRGWYHESWNIQPVLLRQGPELGVKRIQDEGSYKYVEV
jgi:hypothetical protein